MKNTIATIILAIAVLFIGFASLFHIWSTELKAEQSIESSVKCIREDIGAVVLMDSTQIQDDREYAYTASYTCRDSATTSILRFAKEFEDMDYFGPWVVVITRTPDYKTEERVFCTSHTRGRETLTVAFQNGNREHTSFKYKDSEWQTASSACSIAQYNLVAEFKNKWKL